MVGKAERARYLRAPIRAFSTSKTRLPLVGSTRALATSTRLISSGVSSGLCCNNSAIAPVIMAVAADVPLNIAQPGTRVRPLPTALASPAAIVLNEGLRASRARGGTGTNKSRP